MRHPSLKTDYWQLRSAEKSHAEHPDTFWIPPLKERQQLQRGQAARLIFDIEAEDEETGELKILGERMWVIVSEKVGNNYIGILDNQSFCTDFKDSFYLKFGAEVPFAAEHIIDIANPPQEYVDWQLGQVPEGRWPRI